ncbi:MAG: 50S ribosomal protein L6 [Candidatus Omnitrophica bacterium]|nr:50S ribosomal protein L6 [Candidatus Omnitrophota bacterium]MCM8798080.1 50S ribosomal protein L6 [Candidatus Omnitrophota bacterium]
MSKLGKRPISIPQDIKILLNQNEVIVEGPKGKRNYFLPAGIKAVLKEDKLFLTRASEEKQIKAWHGLARSEIVNIIKGLREGFSKELEIVGIGYRAQVSGKNLVLYLGFSHPVNFPIPEGITIETPKPTQIIVKGIDKQKVGEVSAEIRAIFKPEPYKGKGIRYVGEYVRKKAGKAVA